MSRHLEKRTKIFCALLLMILVTNAAARSFNGTESDRDKRAIPAAIAAAFIAGGFAITGASISAGTLHSLSGYARTFNMEITNHLKYTLEEPRALIWYGHIMMPPVEIAPCYVEGASGHEARGSTGTSGIMHWRIPKLDVNIEVYWSVPYSGRNRLGIGLYHDDEEQKPTESNVHHLFSRFTGSSCSNSVNCEIKDYYWSTSQICVIRQGIKLCGTMGSDAKPIIAIHVAADHNSEELAVTSDLCEAKKYISSRANN